MESAGFLGQLADLPDLLRWRFMRHILTMNQPPPPDTVARCSVFPQFSAHPGTPWRDARMEGDDIRTTTPSGELAFDYVIIGAGFVMDPARRPELRAFAPSLGNGVTASPHPPERRTSPLPPTPISRAAPPSPKPKPAPPQRRPIFAISP
jgi:hypothetical protein